MDHEKRGYIARNELIGRVESYLLSRTTADEFQVDVISATQLLTWNRIDVSNRMLYLKWGGHSPSRARQIYLEDVRCQSEGGFVDPDNSSKRGFGNFITDFRATASSIRDYGFQAERTLIPLARDGSILNGSHRTAAAAFYGRDVTVVHTALDPLRADFRYFEERAFVEELLVESVLNFLEYANNIYLAFLWPSGRTCLERTSALFDCVVYECDLSLTPRGAENLLHECYRQSDWIGEPSDGYPGIRQKLAECFPHTGDVRCVLFQCESVDRVRQVKASVRAIVGAGFSSIHITDTEREVRDLAGLVFSPSGRHFLNHAEPRKFSALGKIEKVSAQIRATGVDMDSALVDGSLLLELYGLRQAKDIDVLSKQKALFKSDLGCSDYSSQLGFHSAGVDPLLALSEYSFRFRGLRVVSFAELQWFKRSRRESKDDADVALMGRFPVNSIGMTPWRQLRYKIHFSSYVFRQRLLSRLWLTRRILLRALKHVGLYENTQAIYRGVLCRVNNLLGGARSKPR